MPSRCDFGPIVSGGLALVGKLLRLDLLVSPILFLLRLMIMGLVAFVGLRLGC